MNSPVSWLNDAILYEIYPQSFADSNGDGVGDFPGAIAKLDYLQWLGINTVWINPCFESPFVDAGYDVSDYLRVAPRYGTNEDLEHFIAEASARGIRVLLDLVVGHTSTEHAWFGAEAALPGPNPLGDRYIWAVAPPAQVEAVGVPGATPWVRAPGNRPGFYLKNFFEAQPALNFGYARMRDGEPWRQPVDAPGPMRNRQSLREIMAFWLDRGAAGFRVDMAFSLVKDDEGLVETLRLWHEMREWLDASYPDAVILPEGVEPLAGSAPSFDGDFFLVIGEEHTSLFDNGGAGRLPWMEQKPCYFDAAARGSLDTFLTGWRRVRRARPARPVIMGSADHDYSRLAMGARDRDQVRAAWVLLMTWGTVPAIYYGDEIGMRYLAGLPDKEGSVCHPGWYNRAGVRTPMQWDAGGNAGFSTGDPATFYLPIDPSPARPDVASQMADPASLLCFVRALVHLRKSEPAFNTIDEPEVLHAGYPFVFRRGEFLIVLNPGRDEVAFDLELPGDAEPVIGSGVSLARDSITSQGFGHAVFRVPAWA